MKRGKILSQIKSSLAVPALAAAILPQMPGILVHAAILTAVPAQGDGTMLMPLVAYHANTGNVTVDLSMINETAQLSPLLVSDPNDSFDPADPWFDSLDPSQKGLAFNVQYGFTMDPNTDLLPGGQQLWIREITNSPNLGFYNYSATPKLWAPIFGTDGSTNATYWSGMMWMLAATAPPGTNNYSAAFEVYVANSTTGQEAPGSSSGPFVLNWTDVPDGRPQLNIATDVAKGIVISWPAGATNWVLVSSASLASANWTLVTNAPVPINGQSAVYFAGGAPQCFFCLQRNP
jgi:hypothetical protein